MSDSVQPHRWQPTSLHRPWDSPGKNTGGGCHFPLQCMKVKSESEVTQLCPTLSDPMDCSLPGSSIHGIFQARVLEWGAIGFSTPLNALYTNGSPSSLAWRNSMCEPGDYSSYNSSEVPQKLFCSCFMGSCHMHLQIGILSKQEGIPIQVSAVLSLWNSVLPSTQCHRFLVAKI